MEIRGSEISLQVNVSNLFDKEVVRPTSYGSYRSGTESVFVADRFHVQEPRRVLITVSARF
jgi:outer membrane receptor protein involved in Fe transport